MLKGIRICIIFSQNQQKYVIFTTKSNTLDSIDHFVCRKESLGGTPNIRKIKSKLETKDISVISMPHECKGAFADPENSQNLMYLV